MRVFERLAAKSALGAFLTVLALVMGSRPAYGVVAGDSVAGFYSGKTVTILVGYSAGGGYDLYARLLGRHLGRYVPGSPTVIIQNMPGAASLVAANHLYNAAPRDGTVFGMFDPLLVLRQLAGDIAVRFDSARFNWMGSMNADTGVIFVRTDAPVRRFEDVFTRSLKIGAPGVGAVDYYTPLILNGVLGTRFEIVSGYPGSNEVDLAIERGEVQGRHIYWSSLKSRRLEWVRGAQPLARILVQTGLTRSGDLPDVPLVMEYASTEAVRSLFEAFFVPLAMARPFAAPPGVPAQRVAALRKAFSDALQDPRLRAEAEQVKVMLEGALDGDALQGLVERIMNTPADQVKVLAQYILS